MNTHNVSRSGWNPWPISIIAFFSIAILGCGTFVTFCSRNPADLITPNYYEEEVRYQGQIDRMNRAQQRASIAVASYDSATKQIIVSLPGDPSHGKYSGEIQLYRPSAATLDRHLKLDLDLQGTQAVDGSLLLPGLWKVRVSWTVDNRDYFIDQKIIIPSRS